MSTYSEDSNPYKQWHMRRAFRLGWEAAEQGLDGKKAEARARAAKLNQRTTPAWWRGFDAERDGRSGGDKQATEA